MALAGQRALVTGGARGIGQAIAEVFEQQECEVVTLDIDPSTADRAHYEVDLARTEILPETVATIERDCGPVDILINCAAMQSRAPFAELDAAHFQQVMKVNVEAPVFLSQAVAVGMAERGYGRIVNITSIHGSRGARQHLAYDMSKAALGALTRTLGIELAASGILVTAVAPGFVDTRGTDLTTDAFKTVYQGFGKLPLGRAARPEEVALQVAWLASPQNTYVSGTALAVDGGMSATF